jgi:hypothetical protein
VDVVERGVRSPCTWGIIDKHVRLEQDQTASTWSRRTFKAVQDTTKLMSLSCTTLSYQSCLKTLHSYQLGLYLFLTQTPCLRMILLNISSTRSRQFIVLQ